MSHWRTMTALVLTGFLTTVFFATIVTTPTTVSAANVTYAPADQKGSGVSLMSHKMTYEEVHVLMRTVGVREPNRDYNVIVDDHGTGLAPPTEEQWIGMVDEINVVDGYSPGSKVLASAMDLSSSPTFPKVGNQAGQGSCAAWAATYYTYGYMEATDNGWTDAKTGAANHLISPAWTYNKVNGGGDRGSWMSTNMMIIRDWGGATMATHPYSDSDPLGWGPMEAFREAPLHRAVDVYYINYMGQQTVDTVKALINNGFPVTFAFDAGQYTPAFADGNYIMTAKEYSSSTLNHAQTIVGYDDIITDDGEVGAFRVVNSWSSGWGDGGFYWLTYDGFKELGLLGVLNLTYIEDMVAYVPTMLGVWHFNQAPSRNTDPKLGIGPYSSPYRTRTPYFEKDSVHRFPTFMALDVSEFKDVYDTGVGDFFLSFTASTMTGTISSFRVELYEGGFVPGAATQISGQSTGIPKSLPGYVTAYFDHYARIAPDNALDLPGTTFASSTFVRWVGVASQSSYGGASMQSGDIGDSRSTKIQTSVTGPVEILFDWKVSSEAGRDLLSLNINSFRYASISGYVDWQAMRVSLGPGVYVLEWEYSKDASNSDREDSGWIDNLIMDTVPPCTQAVLSGTLGGGGWYRSSVAVDLIVSDIGRSGVAFTNYRLDGGSWQSYFVQLLVSGDGDHTIEYYSVDMAGNVEAPSQTSFKIDTVAPTTVASLDTTVGNNGWYVSPVNVTLTSSDAASGPSWTTYKVDNGSWQGYTQTFRISGDGIHTLELQSGDIAGNLESPTSAEIKIDLAGPTTNVSLAGMVGNNGWYTSSVDLSMVASDATSNVDTIRYRIDGASWDFYSSTFAVSGDGLHVVEYSSVDMAGNKEDDRSVAFKIDTTPPVLFINQVNGTLFSSVPVTIGWSGWDATSGLDYLETSADGAPFVRHPGTTSFVQLAGLSDGGHSISVRAVDMAGLSTETSIMFVLDTTPPITSASVSGTSGLNGWYSSSVTILLDAADLTTAVESTYYAVDGGLWQRYMLSLSFVADGIYVISYYSTDSVGNVETRKQTTVRIDIIGPVTSSGLDGTTGANGWYVSSVDVTLSAMDATSGIGLTEYRLDGGNWQTYSGALAVSDDGAHTVEFHSIDVCGNAEAVKNLTFKVDRTAPALEVRSPTGNLSNPNVLVTWFAEDVLSGLDRCEVSVDGSPFELIGCGTALVRYLSDGNHVVLIRAVDRAGNEAEVRADYVISAPVAEENGGLTVTGVPVHLQWIVVVLLILLLLLVVWRRRQQMESRRSRLPIPPPPLPIPPPPPPPPPPPE